MAVVISNVQAMDDGWMLTVDGLKPDELVGHHVWIPTGAIEDRVAAYGLPDTALGRRRAVAYIIREHRLRLAQEVLDPTTITVPGTW